MAGTVAIASKHKVIGKGPSSKRVQVIIVDWVADSAAATVPDTDIEMYGYLYKIITNPGSTAPTANYDVLLKDPEDTALDALGGFLAACHTSTTEQWYPYSATGLKTPLLAGTYKFAIANNAVNSALGRVIFYLADEV